MKNEFAILETPLPSPLREETADTGEGVAALIKRCAKLMNNLEKETEKAEKWKRELFLELLEVVDSLERTLSQAEKLPQQAATEKWVGHVRATAHQLSWLLKRRGIVPFDTMGKEADPGLTEIVGEMERDNCMDDEVVEEVGKGYLYQGQLLRRARVIVARKKEAENHDKNSRY